MTLSPARTASPAAAARIAPHRGARETRAMALETFAVMLRAAGRADYVAAGHVALPAAPARGAAIAFAQGGRTIAATVDALVIPPGCEENCIGTVFVSEA